MWQQEYLAVRESVALLILVAACLVKGLLSFILHKPSVVKVRRSEGK